MAMLPLRLRRALTTLTSLRHTLPAVRPAAPPLLVEAPASTCAPPALSLSSLSVFQSRFFRSSAGLSDSSKSYKLYKEGDEITEDTILFEGCDYNHWLITVDFPRDNKPSREEMIRTYEEICAKGLGVSVEEAKKRIYACSTTTYEGFQVEMTEEESEKFHDVPGVVFVLPDSYIDPANKQYGGDKYENGVITPRPPPVTFGRNQRRDRRNPDRSGSPNWQRTPSPNQQGFMRGDGRNNEYPQRFVPSYQINYGQGSNFDYGQNHGYGSNPGHGQGSNPGHGQGSNSGYRQNNRQGPSAPHRDYGQGTAPGRGQNYEQPLGAGPSFTELVQQEGEGIQPIFPPFEQKGANNDKGR